MACAHIYEKTPISDFREMGVFITKHGFNTPLLVEGLFMCKVERSSLTSLRCIGNRLHTKGRIAGHLASASSIPSGTLLTRCHLLRIFVFIRNKCRSNGERHHHRLKGGPVMPEYIDTIIASGKQFSDKDFEKKVPNLTYLGGDQVGRRIMLADDRVTLGRSPEATIMLRDNHVSRLHIAIAFDPDRNGYRIQDLGSSNGTLLNGAHISGAILQDSDKILIGETMLRFRWSDVLDLQYQTEIDNLVNIDELTGLVVKRRFDEELNRYIAVAKTQGKGLAMIMMDLDGL